MANRNCLEGLRCPQCGSYEPLNIAISCVVQFWDDGSNDDYSLNLSWETDSYCECGECCFAGLIKDFNDPEYVEESDANTPRPD